jgi:hypothetical protein
MSQDIFDEEESTAKTSAEKQKEFDDASKDVDFILAKPRGRRWLYHMAYENCHVDRQSHVRGDPESSAYNEGGRAVGLALIEDIKARSPSAYMKMLEENAFNG